MKKDLSFETAIDLFAKTNKELLLATSSTVDEGQITLTESGMLFCCPKDREEAEKVLKYYNELRNSPLTKALK